MHNKSCHTAVRNRTVHTRQFDITEAVVGKVRCPRFNAVSAFYVMLSLEFSFFYKAAQMGLIYMLAILCKLLCVPKDKMRAGISRYAQAHLPRKILTHIGDHTALCRDSCRNRCDLLRDTDRVILRRAKRSARAADTDCRRPRPMICFPRYPFRIFFSCIVPLSASDRVENDRAVP